MLWLLVRQRVVQSVPDHVLDCKVCRIHYDISWSVFYIDICYLANRNNGSERGGYMCRISILMISLYISIIGSASGSEFEGEGDNRQEESDTSDDDNNSTCSYYTLSLHAN